MSHELGPYRVIRRIAVGGMAEVFEARRESSEESVVLKVLLPGLAEETELVQMFEDEARLAQRLEHPSLIRVLELAAIGGQRAMVMEYVDGPTLAAIQRRLRATGRPFPVGPALVITSELLSALEYLHRLTGSDGAPLDFVHRDVTPGNVLVSRRGEVKLGDFGIARHRLRSKRTRTGVIKGTVQYMSPEQIAGGEIDARSDLYGAGLILFEMITGRPFIEGETELDLLKIAGSPRWVAPSALHPGIDARLDRLLEPALRRFPEERYPSAASFLAALRETGLLTAEGERQARQELESLAGERADGARQPFGSLDTPTQETAAPGTVVRRAGEIRPRRGRASGALLLLGAALVLCAGLALIALRPWGGARSRETVSATHADARGGSVGRQAQAARPVLPLDAGPRRVADSRASAARDRSAGATRPRRHSPGRIVASASPDAGRVPVPAPTSDEALTKLRRELEGAMADLTARGLLDEDLSPQARAALRAARRSQAAQDVPAAAHALKELEPLLAAARVDRALVEAKLKRVDARLRSASGRPADLQALRDKASLALQEFMDGRYEAANAQLNSIIATLARTGP